VKLAIEAPSASQENAAARFGKGEGLYFITGPWENQTFAGPLKDGVGFFPLPSDSGTAAAPTTGALSIPYHISAKSKNKAVAAAFLNFIANPHAAAVVIQHGDLPAASPQGASIDPNSSLASISQAWVAKSKAGILTPYLDWATPTMGDTLFGGLQKLSVGQETPGQFASAVQADWEKTHS